MYSMSIISGYEFFSFTYIPLFPTLPFPKQRYEALNMEEEEVAGKVVKSESMINCIHLL